ncbi:MAG: AMMECR1 domain-containing protein [Promethearchaeia archaeon]
MKLKILRNIWRNWDVKTFLQHTCQKAWLPADAWKDKKTKLYKFGAILFEEEEPNGEIKRKYIRKK